MSNHEDDLVPLTALRFDPLNPRLPLNINGESEAQVIRWMLTDASIIDLMGSIGEHGYFPGEPLLVVPAGGKSDALVVVEGNRRVAALKLLADPSLAQTRKKAVATANSLAKFKPTQVPVDRFGNRDDILDYLGYRHVTGVKEWDPLAKARYLKQLADRDAKRGGVDLQELARGVGSRSDYVARLLNGLGVYNAIADEDFFDIAGLDENSMEFSVLTTALAYSNIAKFVGLKSARDVSPQGLESDHLRELTTWVFKKNSEGNTRLGESRNLKQLSAVVDPAAPRALEAFRRGVPLGEAARFTKLPLDALRAILLEARSKLGIALEQMPMVENPTEADAETVKEISLVAHSLLTLLNEKLASADDQ